MRIFNLVHDVSDRQLHLELDAATERSSKITISIYNIIIFLRAAIFARVSEASVRSSREGSVVWVLFALFFVFGRRRVLFQNACAHLGDRDKWPLLIYLHSASPSTGVGCIGNVAQRRFLNIGISLFPIGTRQRSNALVSKKNIRNSDQKHVFQLLKV